jgi:hypothetical protein
MPQRSGTANLPLQARLLEARASEPSFEAHVSAERSQSDFYGGRRVGH